MKCARLIKVTADSSGFKKKISVLFFSESFILITQSGSAIYAPKVFSKNVQRNVKMKLWLAS